MREPRDLRREVGRCETGGKQAELREPPSLVHMGARIVLRVPGRASGCACTVYANARGRRRAPPSDTAAARAARHAPTDFAFCDSLCTTNPAEPACTYVVNSIEPADCSATQDTYQRNVCCSQISMRRCTAKLVDDLNGVSFSEVACSSAPGHPVRRTESDLRLPLRTYKLVARCTHWIIHESTFNTQHLKLLLVCAFTGRPALSSGDLSANNSWAALYSRDHKCCPSREDYLVNYIMRQRQRLIPGKAIKTDKVL